MNAPSGPALTSSRPYLLRAIYDWLTDNNLTPHLIAAAAHPGVTIPPGSARDGRVVLNIAPRAVRDLLIDTDGVSFVARFGGITQSVYLPMPAVLGIFARENGVGILFDAEDGALAGAGDADSTEADAAGNAADHVSQPPPGAGRRPQLKIIK